MQSAGECPQTLHGQDILHSRSPTTVGRCCVTPHITLGRPRSSLTDLHLIPPCAASAWTWCSREGAATPYVPVCGRGQCPMKGFQNSFFSGSGTASVGRGLHATRECPPSPCHIQLACLSQKRLERFPISYTTVLTPNILRQLSSASPGPHEVSIAQLHLGEQGSYLVQHLSQPGLHLGTCELRQDQNPTSSQPEEQQGWGEQCLGSPCRVGGKHVSS